MSGEKQKSKRQRLAGPSSDRKTKAELKQWWRKCQEAVRRCAALLLSLRRSAVSDFPDTMITQGNKENEVWLIVEFVVL